MRHTTDDSPQCSPFSTAAWFDILTAYGLPTHVQRVDAPAGEAILPLLREGDNESDKKTGGDFSALSSYYSPSYTALANAPLSIAEAEAFAVWLRSQKARSLQLKPMLPGALFDSLQAALRNHGFMCDTLGVSTNHYLSVPDGMDWAAYLAQRPGRLRNTCKRCTARLEREPGFRIEICRTLAELSQALAAFETVYRSSWKGAEPYPQFIPELCRAMATSGWLRLGVLYLHGEPAAAQLWFVKDTTASIYKLAYDASHARWGVGTVLTAAMFEEALDRDGVREIDFLTGDDEYKTEWMSATRPLLCLIAYNSRSLGGLVLATRHFAGKWARRLFHKLRTRR
ncbi:MAG: hypothetical protein JWN23_3165 [Rhodocyclales bacterium]|nr:hypothetical protein [Rhodocyclales bacterium]